MNIDKVTFQTTYNIGPFLNVKVGFEAVPSNDWIKEDGGLKWETPEMILSKLKKMADDWHKSEYPHLYQEGTKPEEYPKPYDGRDRFHHATSGQIPTTEIEFYPQDDTLQLIQNATDLETLKSFKVIASSDTTKVLYNAYNKRLKELM